jgi:hypothetical protein
MATLQQTVDRWKAGASQGQTRFVEGVQATTEDPTQAAIAAQQKLLQGFNDAVQSGRWARNLAAVGMSGWKQATLDKANNYSTGINAGAGKYQTRMQTWLPITQQNAASVRSMPNNSFADSLARMQAFATAQHNAKLQGA